MLSNGALARMDRTGEWLILTGAKNGGSIVVKSLAKERSVCGVLYDLMSRKFSIASPIKRSYCRIRDTSPDGKPARLMFSDSTERRTIRLV